MRNISHFFPILLLALLTSACSTYKLGEKSYSTRAEAEAVAAAHNRKQVDQIEALKSPITSKPARCLLMSKDQLKDRGIYVGNGDGLDYVATVFHMSYHTICQQVRKRNIFNGFTQAQSDGDHVPPAKDEVVIYLYTPGKGKIGWYYASEKIKITPLHFDHAAGDDKVVKYFLDSIEALALSE